MSTARGGLLAIQTKRAESLSLAKGINAYARTTYADRGESILNDAIADLEEVDKLRAEILSNSNTVEKQAEQLVKYYGMLSAMELRFPISKDSSHISNLSFVWWDAFKSSKKEKQQNINFEKCSILFNLAALHSQQGIDQDRTTSEGLKFACKKFQEAAGVFSHMKENVSMRTDAPHPLDISPDASKMLEQLMLAQAQECVFEKAMNEGKSEGVCARLGKQCYLFYNEVVQIIAGSSLNSYMDKSWISHLKSKCLYFSAEPEMLMAEAEKKKDESDIGPQIARLRYADLKIKECEKVAKSANAFVLEASKKLSQVISSKLTKAVKDNETIYLEKVPPHNAIPAISEAAMVKSVPPQNLNKASGDVFVGLVPDSSAKVVSKYTEMVDSLIKTEKDKLNASTEQARSKLKELNLPDLLLSLEPTSRLLDTILSETLREKIAEVNSFGGVSHCFELAKELQGLRNTGTQMVNSAEQELDAEAAEDSSEREKFKDKWLIPASATLTNVLRESISEFRTKIEAARSSDKSTIQQLEQPENPILCLESDKLLGQVPYLKKPMVSIGAADADTVISGLKEALVRLENCASERACLEDQLNEAKFKDNILPQLMSSSDSEENIFRNQLEKYKPLQVSVSESVKTQEGLISNLSKKHVDFVSVFNIGEWKAECDAFSAKIQNAYELYKQIQSNFERGIRFYTSLQDAIGQLKQQCGDFCLTRKMQRDDFLRQLAYSQAQQQQHAQQQQQQQQPSHGAMPPQYPPPSHTAAYPPQQPPQYTPQGGPYHQQQQPQYGAPPPPAQPSHYPPPPGAHYNPPAVYNQMAQMHISSPTGQPQPQSQPQHQPYPQHHQQPPPYAAYPPPPPQQ